jgi:hypothetical protein
MLRFFLTLPAFAKATAGDVKLVLIAHAVQPFLLKIIQRNKVLKASVTQCLQPFLASFLTHL